MDRVNSPDHIMIDGKRHFSDGDQHSFPEKPATVLQAQFLNDLQEEICGYIESQGIELNCESRSNLGQAISKQIQVALNPINAQINALWEKVGKEDINEPVNRL